MLNLKIILNCQTPETKYISDVPQWIDNNLELIDSFSKFCHSNSKAIGLAANQISVNGDRLASRFFCYKKVESEVNQWECIINPKIISYVGESEEVYEKCLTWPNKTIIVQRFPQLLVSYWNKDKIFLNNVIVKDFVAQVWQHEIDHLNGINEKLINVDQNTVKNTSIKIGRNEICSCGSGKKFKKCCLLKQEGATLRK